MRARRSRFVSATACVVISVGALASPARATDKCGEVGGEVWDLAGSPYVITCDVTVAAGSTLRIEAGVDVRFRADRGMTVDGTLDVDGTSGSRVVFTSDASAPAVRDWDRVELRGSAVGYIDHASFLYADHGLYIDDSATVTLDGVIATRNYNGVGVGGAGPPSVTATGCRFVDNEWIGFLVEITDAPKCSTPVTITDSELYGSGRDDIHVSEFMTERDPEVTIDARGNWWGTTDSGVIAQNIHDSRYGDHRGTVDACDYLDGPGGSVARSVHCPALVVCTGATETWDRTDRPYLLTSDVEVYGTLNVGPGVEVRAAAVPVGVGCKPGKVGIWADGGATVAVSATAGSPATLTSDAASPAMSDWSGLATDGTIDLDHAIVRYADKNLVMKGSMTASNTTFRDHRLGFDVASWDGALTVTESEVLAPDEYAVIVNADEATPNPPAISINRTTLEAGSLGTVHVEQAVDPTELAFDFRDNWWGTTEPDDIEAAIHDQRDDPASAIVDWCGYLDGPSGTRMIDAHCPELAVCGATDVWSSTDKPYVLVSDLHVCATATLQVDAGVAMRAIVLEPGLGLRVHGGLDVDGAPGSPATFGSDDAVPAPGDWAGITLDASASATLDYATIRDAHAGLHASGSSSVTLDHVTMTLNQYGLRVLGEGAPVVTVTNGTMTDNSFYGIEVGHVTGFPNPSLDVSHSEIHSNGSFDFYADTFADPGETVVNANRNWWGTTDTTWIANAVHDHADASSSPIVDWCGYLESPGGTGRDVHCPTLVACYGSETWDLTDKPYLATSSVYVCPSGSLTIGPDVDVLMADTGASLDFRVEGTLDVAGTAATPVTIGSDAAAPAAQDWSGIDLSLGAVATIDHATIRHADTALRAVDSVSLTLDGVTATESRLGLFVRGDGPPTVSATGSAFVSNLLYGAQIQRASGAPDPDVSIHSCALHSNGGVYDLLVQYYASPDTSIVDFRNNWWGTTDTGTIGPRIYDHRTSTTSPRVDWCGYLDGPGGSPARDTHCPDLVICDENAVWDLADQPYLLTTDFRVCPTGTLHVEQGVDVRTVEMASSQPEFVVEGTLDVNGSPGNLVRFDSDAPSPAASDWRGPAFRGGAIATIDHAELLHAARGIDVGDAADVTLSDVTARLNRVGLYVNGAGPPSVTATGSAFVDNTLYGAQIQRASGAPNPALDIHDSAFHSNGGSYDLLVQYYDAPETTVVDLRDNWWGSSDTTRIGPRIYDHRTAGTSPRADWCGYLDGPGGSPVRDVHCPQLVACGETVVWDRTDKPYQLTTDFWVCPTGTLEVGPGVDVRTVATTPRPDFLVEGTMRVDGTAAEPARFASDAPSPGPGDWFGPAFGGDAVATLDHAEFLHGSYGLDLDGAADVTLDGVTVRDNTTGLHVRGPGPPSITATNSSFIENAQYGVQLQRQAGAPNPITSLHDCALHSNGGSYDLLVQYYDAPDATVVDVRDNWWGTTDTTAIGPRIYDHRTSGTSPRADWCRYLDGPGGVPARDTHCPDLVVCDETAVWDLTDKPYLLTTDFWVCPATGRLEVGEGVDVRTVETTTQPDFLVEGELDVDGTWVFPAVFRSDAPAPEAGDWGGLLFRGSAVGTLDHADVRHGDYGLDLADAAEVTANGVRAQINTTGVYVYGTGPPVLHAMDSTFTDNTQYGLQLRRRSGYPNPDVTVTRSSIHSNSGGYDLLAQTYESPDTDLVWLTDNWWGTTDHDAIALRIYDRDDSATSPRVRYRAFGVDCDDALGRDRDHDGLPDFDDNCPGRGNTLQDDTDMDGMGDLCDPDPSVAPTGACDGLNDAIEGWLDADADGWGDPCDFHPLRDDAYPGAPERCDARDNDGDALYMSSETVDADFDFDVACGDCDDTEPDANVCLCEICDNTIDDDCDTMADAADTDCDPYDVCVKITAGTEPRVTIDKGVCAGATASDPYDTIRGEVGALAIVSGSVDLGGVACVAFDHAWDRVTDASVNLDPKCEPTPVQFYLVKGALDSDYGAASSGERRDSMVTDPGCMP